MINDWKKIDAFLVAPMSKVETRQSQPRTTLSRCYDEKALLPGAGGGDSEAGGPSVAQGRMIQIRISLHGKTRLRACFPE